MTLLPYPFIIKINTEFRFSNLDNSKGEAVEASFFVFYQKMIKLQAKRKPLRLPLFGLNIRGYSALNTFIVADNSKLSNRG